MKGVRDLHADAIAMQREGMLPHEVARRLIELGNDNGFTSIVHRNSPPKIELLFNGTDHIIRFDGATWIYEPAEA